MALESLSDTPPPLVSKGNNDSDTPANNSELIKGEGPSKDEGGKPEIPAEELEDGEIDDDDVDEEENPEEYAENKGDGEDSEEWDIDPDEARRIRKREKNRQRRKRRKEEKRMQALQAWAMAMAAGEMGDQEEGGGGGEEMASDEEERELMGDEQQQEDMSPKRGERNFSPKKRKQQQRKRQRAPSPSESDDEEFSKLLKQEMSRHKLKPVKSSDESSPESRRMRSPGRFDSGGDAPINVDGEESEEEYESMHRSKKKKRKKHKHHHRKHSSRKMHRDQPTDSQEEEEMDHHRMLPPGGPGHGGPQDYMDQQEPMSEQDQQIMHDHEMGKVHVPKTHLICKFYLENKCKKGLDCSYTHEGSIPKRPEQCKFYLQGHCSKGPLCMFLHKEYPCKYYHTGQICYSEDKCRFSHAPLTEETKELVEIMKKEQAGVKGRDRDSDQAPLLPSPERQNNVSFQKGNPGGKPPKKSSRDIPSLFDIHVQPVGHKGQIILEKERRGLFDLDDRPSYMEEEEEENMDRHESSDRNDGLQDRIGSPMGSPRQHGGHKDSPSSRSRGPSRQHSQSDTPSRRPSLQAPATPVQAEKKTNSTSTLKDPRLRRIKEDHSSSTGEEGHLIEVSSTDNEGETIDLTTEESEREQKSGSNSEPNPEMAAKAGTEKTLTQEKTDSFTENSSTTAGATTEEGSGTESERPKTAMGPPKSSEPLQEKAGTEPAAVKATPPKVVEPPKSMPAKSKALFMRIQQNQSRTKSDSEGREGSSTAGEKETDGDDNWYSSDEEDSDKKASDGGPAAAAKQGPQLKVNLDSGRGHKVTPSTISPEASNRGPLLSSVLIANNKQNSGSNAQSALPGPLASLFSNSQTTPVSGGATVKTPPLPLNILDLVTKGTSSIQKSTSPKVQDLFAGILPQRKTSQEGYRLLECIRDPNLKDPRMGRERKSKKGMMFRVLRWKRCEYSVSDPDDRPTLPPIELTTPTELKSPPAFPAVVTQTAEEARTQAMVDVIKKVINEVRNQPADPRTQNPANNPQMAHHDPRAFPTDPRAAQQQQQMNFPPGHPGHMGPPGMGPQNMGPYGPMQNQLPVQQHGPHQRPPGPGPGFVRHPMGPPNQSFPPRMLRPPQVPTGFARPPRFGQQGPRGPRPIRPERMQHRPNRPVLQPPFGSPTRGGPPHPDRMPHPPGPRFGNPRMEMRDAPIGEAPADPRDPRTGANRVGVGDPRLARRGSTTDVDMRVKDPRLARMQQQQGQSGGVGAGDIDMRQLNSPPGQSSTPGGRADPRQAARGNPTNDVDLRHMPPGGQGGEDSGIPLKDMFKGRDPTASPFV